MKSLLDENNVLKITANWPTKGGCIRSPHTIRRISRHIIQNRTRKNRRTFHQMRTIPSLHPDRDQSYSLPSLFIVLAGIQLLADAKKLAVVAPRVYYVLDHFCFATSTFGAWATDLGTFGIKGLEVEFWRRLGRCEGGGILMPRLLRL